VSTLDITPKFEAGPNEVKNSVGTDHTLRKSPPHRIRCSASRFSLRTVFGGFSYCLFYCPFRTENWLYSVERIEAGETVDSKNAQ
jgi:hypothetical protein